MPPAETVIFEGAQGVLLDEWHGLHPYTTWSTVTPLHARELAAEHGIENVTVLGLTRAVLDAARGRAVSDVGPGVHRVAGRSRQPAQRLAGVAPPGPLDLVLLDYAARICRVDALAVTCLDQLPARPRVATHYADLRRVSIPISLREQAELTRLLKSAVPIYREASTDELLAILGAIAPLTMMSRGPTSADWTWASGGRVAL